MSAAADYAQAVLDGQIVAGPYVRGSCERFLHDLKRKDIEFVEEAADAANRFFEQNLTVISGGNSCLWNLGSWQKFSFANIWGWHWTTGGKGKKGYRRFRRGYFEIGKGNGKSGMGAGCALLAMGWDNHPSAEVYSIAATYDQASIVLKDAARMIRGNPDLQEHYEQIGSNKSPQGIYLRANDALFKPLTQEYKRSGSGPKPIFVVSDEIHEHPDGELLGIMDEGLNKMDASVFHFMITNSGSSKLSACWLLHEHAVRVALGKIQDDLLFSYVCAMDKGDMPFEDETCWIKANPGLGEIKPIEGMRAAVQKAKNIPAERNRVARLHFCEWTQSDTAWIQWSCYDDCLADLDIKDYEGHECYQGLDLSAKTDMTAKSLVFRGKATDDGQPTYDAFVHCWMPEANIVERGREDGCDYAEWAQMGFITLVPGFKISLDWVATDLAKDACLYAVQQVAYDRWSYALLEEILENRNIDLPTAQHPQGFNRVKDCPLWMPGSIDTLETLILERRIRIARNPVLTMAAAGAVFDPNPDGNRRFAKKRATCRIDALVALAQGIGAATADWSGQSKQDGPHLMHAVMDRMDRGEEFDVDRWMQSVEEKMVRGSRNKDTSQPAV